MTTISHADIPRLYLETESGHPYPATNPVEWAHTRASEIGLDANVAHTRIPSPDQDDDDTVVSTVFLGFSADPTEVPPACYETLVLRGTGVVERLLSSTRQDAEQIHDDTVEQLQSLQ